MKKIYIIRHCEAEGQASEAQLTDRGFKWNQGDGSRDAFRLE